MISIEQVFHDGTTVTKKVKNVKEAKTVSKSKKSPLKLIRILELVSGIVLAVIPILTKKK